MEKQRCRAYVGSRDALDTHEKPIAELELVFLALVKTLVSDAESVLLKVDDNGKEILFHFYVAKLDLGKIIGKQGRNARALRVLLTAAGMKYSRRFELEIDAREDPRSSRS